MKLKSYGMVLGMFFALGLVFSFSMEVSASHGDGTSITAAEVDPTKEADVRAFLDHIIDYYDQVVSENAHDRDALTRGTVVFGRHIRQEGDYKHSEMTDMPMYSMGIRENKIVSNHARYPNRFGWVFNSSASDSAVASTIQTLIANSGVGMTDCQQYGAEGRVACAEKVRSDAGDVTVIAGLHHAEDDSAFELPDCAEFSLGTTAEDVFGDQSDDNLVAYVKGVIRVTQRLVADATEAQFAEFEGDLLDLSDPTSSAAQEFGRGLLQRVYAKSACFGEGDFKHGNIYAFIMDANPTLSTVLFNGNNFDLNGSNLELDDDELPGDDKSISGLFARALGAAGIGDNAYVNYHWDDPTTPDDDVPNFFEERKVPGTSCKRSYIEVADINAAITPNPGIEILYIVGSGTYPGDDVCASGGDGDGGDDGCAIAGAGHTSQSTLLNLFLTAFVLFSVVFLRKRA
ncbi:MAG: hypothetical protein F4Z56_05135 [Candidatus Dadabacteria bacterium]|nr:hypothetical protein [Candidatus Dadabacteria bacterium]